MPSIVLAEKAEYDFDALKIEIEELIDAEVPIVGFSDAEIDHILQSAMRTRIEPGPLEPRAGAVAVSRLGDVFRLGPHRVICGSAINPDAVRLLMLGTGLQERF